MPRMHIPFLLLLLLGGTSLMARGMSYDIVLLASLGWLCVRGGGMYWFREGASGLIQERYREYGRILLIAVSSIFFCSSLFDYIYIDAVVRLIMLGSAAWAGGQFRGPLQRGKTPIQGDVLLLFWIVLLTICLLLTDRLGMDVGWILVSTVGIIWCLVVRYYLFTGHHRGTLKRSILFGMISSLRGLTIGRAIGVYLLRVWDQYEQQRTPKIQEVYIILPASTPIPFLPLPEK